MFLSSLSVVLTPPWDQTAHSVPLHPCCGTGPASGVPFFHRTPSELASAPEIPAGSKLLLVRFLPYPSINSFLFIFFGGFLLEFDTWAPLDVSLFQSSSLVLPSFSLVRPRNFRLLVFSWCWTFFLLLAHFLQFKFRRVSPG